MAFLLQVLERNNLGDGVVAPEGAFYMLVPCEGDSHDFAEGLIREKSVAVAPGKEYRSREISLQ